MRPIYRATSAYGHFGRSEFPWEKTDRAAKLADDLLRGKSAAKANGNGNGQWPRAEEACRRREVPQAGGHCTGIGPWQSWAPSIPARLGVDLPVSTRPAGRRNRGARRNGGALRRSRGRLRETGLGCGNLRMTER